MTDTSLPLASIDAQPAAELERRVQHEAARVLVGMEQTIHSCLCALLAGGHLLLEGPPGVAKTLLVRTLAEALGGSYARVQFTPDLMPADVTGTSVYHPGEGSFRFRRGPIFAHFVLCDEINRAPAKTQSALLEAMQEGAVTADGTNYVLPAPFAVFATMNPIEHEGTYALPEAQLDRFLFKLEVGYPTPEQEARLLTQAHARGALSSPRDLGVQAVTSPEQIAACAQLASRVAVRADLPDYVVKLLRATREHPALSLGASPRAGLVLVRAAKSRALLQGREFVTVDDLKALFLAALRHRVALDPAEELSGTSTDEVLAQVLESVEVPR